MPDLFKKWVSETCGQIFMSSLIIIIPLVKTLSEVWLSLPNIYQKFQQTTKFYNHTINTMLVFSFYKKYNAGIKLETKTLYICFSIWGNVLWYECIKAVNSNVSGCSFKIFWLKLSCYYCVCLFFFESKRDETYSAVMCHLCKSIIFL